MTPPVPVSTTISSSQPATPATPVAPAAPSQAEDAAVLKARIAALEGQVSEKDRAAQYWYGKAHSATPAAAKPADKAPEDDTDLLDLITTKGVKGLDELMAKRGYARKEEVEATVNAKAAQMTEEQELMSQFPDLKKQDSEFFKAVALEYGSLTKAGVPVTQAMKLAAKSVQADFLMTGKVKTPTQEAADKAAAKEAARLARVAAQAGDRGSRQAVDTEDDDTLTDNDEAAVRQLADALEIPLDKARERYIARAKAGVNVSLKLGGRK